MTMRDEELLTRLRGLDEGEAPNPVFVDRLQHVLAGELGLPARPMTPSVRATMRERRDRQRYRRLATLLIAAAVTVALIATLVFLAGAILRTRRAEYTPRLEASTCPRFAPASLSCSVVILPINRDAPSAALVGVFVARVPAQSGTPRPDPLVFVEGPRESETVWLVQTLPGNPAGLKRDLIWIGHRGSGATGPDLSCPEIRSPLLEMLAHPAGDAAALRAWTDGVGECRRRLEGQGLDLESFGPDESADDVADVLGALGYRSWNLETFSLPGVIQRVVRDHSQAMRSVIFDSPVSLDADRFSHAAAAMTKALAALQDACNQAPACRTAHPSVAADLAAQARSYDEEPARLPVAASDGTSVTVLIDGARRWEIARIEVSANERLSSLPDEFGSPRTADLDSRLAVIAAESASTIAASAYGAHLSLVCRDEIPFVDRAEIARAARASPDPGPVVVEPLELSACDVWGSRPTDRGSRTLPPQSVPALALLGTIDPTLPPDAAARLRATFSTVAAVEVPWTNRVVSAQVTDCARSVRDAFLDAPSASPDAACLETGPFATR
jgi:hypothetical protein